MTKAYSKMSVGDALYAAARKYPGSVEALAARLGKSPNVMRSKLAPDVDTHHVTLEEALQIVELLDCTVPSAADMAIKAIAYRLGRVVVRHNGADSDGSTLAEQALALCAYAGLLAAEVAGLSHDGSSDALSERDADRLDDCISKVMDAACLLKDSVETRSGH